MDGSTQRFTLMVLLFVASIVAHLGARQKFSTSITHLFFYFMATTIIAHYFITDNSVNFENTIKLATWLALIASISLLSSAYGAEICLKQLSTWVSNSSILFLGFSLTLATTDRAFSDGAFLGFTENPNIMGAYLALIVAPAISFKYNSSNQYLKKIFFGFLLLTCIILIYMTKSRAAFFAIFIAFVYVVFTTKKVSNIKKVFVILTIIFAPFALSSFIVKYNDGSILFSRDYLIQLRLANIAERPYFGWGFGALVNNTFDRFHIFPPSEKGNTVLQFFEEFGLILGTIFLIFLAISISKITEKLTNTYRRPDLSIFLIACCAHLMMETWILNFSSSMSLYFWTILFFACNLKSKKLKELY